MDFDLTKATKITSWTESLGVIVDGVPQTSAAVLQMLLDRVIASEQKIEGLKKWREERERPPQVERGDDPDRALLRGLRASQELSTKELIAAAVAAERKRCLELAAKHWNGVVGLAAFARAIENGERHEQGGPQLHE